MPGILVISSYNGERHVGFYPEGKMLHADFKQRRDQGWDRLITIPDEDCGLTIQELDTKYGQR